MRRCGFSPVTVDRSTSAPYTRHGGRFKCRGVTVRLAYQFFRACPGPSGLREAAPHAAGDGRAHGRRRRETPRRRVPVPGNPGNSSCLLSGAGAYGALRLRLVRHRDGSRPDASRTCRVCGSMPYAGPVLARSRSAVPGLLRPAVAAVDAVIVPINTPDDRPAADTQPLHTTIHAIR